MPSIRFSVRYTRSKSPSSPGGSSTGATTGPTQITHVSLSIPPPPRAFVAARLSVDRRAVAATAAPQARLCCFQCFFWHGRSQYQARWHCDQHILAPSDWQWKQRWVSSCGAAPLAFLPVLPVLPVVPLAFLVGLKLLLAVAVAAAEASVGGPPPCTISDEASDAARAPSAVFGGIAHAVSLFARNEVRCMRT